MSKKLPFLKRPSIIDTKSITKKNIKQNDYSSETRWLSKEILDEKIILNNQNYHTINITGRGEYKLLDNNIIMNFSTLINELKERSFVTLSFIPQISNWEEYNRFFSKIFIKATGYYNFYFHFSVYDEETKTSFTHATSLSVNEENIVNFEFDHNKRSNVTKVSMGVLITGCPPEALSDVEVTFNDVLIQKVKEDYTLGWNLENRFAFSHIGYYPNSKKIITTSLYENDEFYIYDMDDKLVYQDKISINKTTLGEYILCDFTNFNLPGEYYLKYGNRCTNKFSISKDYLDSSILSSLNFLYSLRCGEEVKGVHSPCHLNSYAEDSDGNRVPVFGGWHDAGDVSQFEICTGEMAHAILDLAEAIDNVEYKELLKEEARVGLSWLLRTRLGNGKRVMGVTYSIWRDNVHKANNHNLNPMKVEEGAFENLIAAAAEAQGYKTFKEEDEIFASWCLRSAMDDYQNALRELEENIYTPRWGKVPESQVYGEAVLTSVLLYQITNNEEYLNSAIKFSKIVMACQQQEYPLWDIPVRGFFYENQDHLTNLVFEHRGHFDAPIYGLTKLCETLEKINKINTLEYNELINTLNLYKEYIITITKYTGPYELLPAGIYEIDKINLNSYTIHPEHKANAKEIITNQITSGIKLNEGVYLRKMGVSCSRRGYHATLLSMTKAVSSTALILKSDELMHIAQKQIEWIMGNNPFASSTMYGEGYNYHPLYVAFSKQMLGALPVGIKTYQNTDEPYWPTINNAVFKEIWGHTTGKYLWVLADLIKYQKRS